MLKKIIQTLLIVLLVLIIAIIIIIAFNPFNTRNKLIGLAINAYFNTGSKEISPASPAPPTNNTSTNKNPLLNPEQEKKLEDLGVDVDALPKEITPAMNACFVEKLGASRTADIANGSEPTALEFFKVRDCLNK